MYISYLSLISILIILLFFFNDLIKKRNIIWLFSVFIFFLTGSANFLFVYSGFWSAFHYGDESYFYDSAIHVINSVKDGGGVIDVLVNYTWNYKYYGFMLFDSLSILGASDTIEAHKLSITIVLACTYLYFIRTLLEKKHIDNFTFLIILLPMMLYLSILNYRDGLISIVCFFILQSIISKKNLNLSIATVLLVFLRVEFVFIIFLSICVSVFISIFKRSSFLNVASFVFLIFFLILFNNKSAFNDSNLILLPLSFNGVSFIYEIFLFMGGEHYYQEFKMIFFLGLILSFSFFMIKMVFIYYFVFGLSFQSFKERFVVNFIVFFYMITMLIYTFMLDGMQDRIKLSFSFLLAVMFSLVYKRIIISPHFKYVFLISFLLSFFVSIINLR